MNITLIPGATSQWKICSFTEGMSAEEFLAIPSYELNSKEANLQKGLRSYWVELDIWITPGLTHRLVMFLLDGQWYGYMMAKGVVVWEVADFPADLINQLLYRCDQGPLEEFALQAGEKAVGISRSDLDNHYDAQQYLDDERNKELTVDDIFEDKSYGRYKNNRHKYLAKSKAISNIRGNILGKIRRRICKQITAISMRMFADKYREELFNLLPHHPRTLWGYFRDCWLILEVIAGEGSVERLNRLRQRLNQPWLKLWIGEQKGVRGANTTKDIVRLAMSDCPHDRLFQLYCTSKDVDPKTGAVMRRRPHTQPWFRLVPILDDWRTRAVWDRLHTIYEATMRYASNDPFVKLQRNGLEQHERDSAFQRIVSRLFIQLSAEPVDIYGVLKLYDRRLTPRKSSLHSVVREYVDDLYAAKQIHPRFSKSVARELSTLRRRKIAEDGTAAARRYGDTPFPINALSLHVEDLQIPGITMRRIMNANECNELAVKYRLCINDYVDCWFKGEAVLFHITREGSATSFIAGISADREGFSVFQCTNNQNQVDSRAINLKRLIESKLNEQIVLDPTQYSTEEN